MFDAALAMRQLRARRKAAGVCIYCEGPLLTSTMCERHADARRPSKAPAVFRNKRRYPIERKMKLK